MPGDNQKSVTVSVELYDLIKGLADKESRSIPGEVEYLVKKEIYYQKQFAELEAFRRSAKEILDSEAFKGGISKL